MNNARQRAVRSSDNDVSNERYELYKATFEWITKSIKEGFYLEAISLEESVIADRLESYLSWHTRTDFSFKTLGTLQKAIATHGGDNNLKLLVANELDQWRKARNKAAHEMVKIEDGKQISWDDRMSLNKTIAEEGLELVRKIDREIRRLRTC
jgi:arginine deiminase